MIHLTVQANDPEVERLLAHLNIQDEDELEDGIFLLERALCWLRASMEGHYKLDPSCEAVLRLNVDVPSPIASPLSHKPSEPL
jgi:hypothetical protein